MLAAYADESESESGSKASAFGGYVAPVNEWDRFNRQWQSILDDYGAAHFHFRQWSIVSSIVRNQRQPHSGLKNNPYAGWNQKKLISFLIDLGGVAGSMREGTFGGYISLNRFNEHKTSGEIPIGESHRDFCLNQCFEAFVSSLNDRWPNHSGPVSFFWDGTKDKKWKNAITSAYEPFKKRDLRLADIVFSDDEKTLPLQAADMVAYRMRQKTDTRFVGNRDVMSELDKRLFGDGKNGFVSLTTFRLLPPSQNSM